MTTSCSPSLMCSCHFMAAEDCLDRRPTTPTTIYCVDCGALAVDQFYSASLVVATLFDTIFRLCCDDDAEQRINDVDHGLRWRKRINNVHSLALINCSAVADSSFLRKFSVSVRGTTKTHTTRSSAVAKRPCDASCLYSFNTKRRAQSFIISCFGFRYTTAYN